MEIVVIKERRREKKYRMLVVKIKCDVDICKFSGNNEWLFVRYFRIGRREK